ncbi:hypothetical protein F885_02534 [Acinetobacter higginsii]|nr:hypothetical protein F885_02534 [Acinetobacter higginsii]
MHKKINLSSIFLSLYLKLIRTLILYSNRFIIYKFYQIFYSVKNPLTPLEYGDFFKRVITLIIDQDLLPMNELLPN